MDIRQLSDLQPGEQALVAALHVNEELFHRLAALGVRVGKDIHVLRRGRFRGPLHLRVGTTELMLRLNDAAHIDVRP